MSVGFGAFAQGLAGGLSIGKSFKDGQKKEDTPKAADSSSSAAQGETGFGIGQNVVSGDISSPQYANSGDSNSGGMWGFLGGLLGGQGGDAAVPNAPGIAGSVLGGKGIGDTLAGKIINTDDPLGSTVGGAIIGKLLK